MTNYTLHDKPAIKMEAKQLADPSNSKAILFEIDGKKVWLPRSCIKKLGDNKILVEEWFYKQRF